MPFVAAMGAFNGSLAAAPTVSSLFPPDGATLIGGRQALRLQFGASVQVGSGNIVLKNSADNSVLESIPVSSSQVSFGSTALFNGFESTVEDWGIWGYATRVWDNSQHHSGSGSLKATTSSNWTQVEGRFPSQNWSGFDSVVCWVYTTNSGTTTQPFMRSGKLDQWTDGLAAPGATLTQNAWTRIAIPISTASDPTRINSFGLNFASAGTYWVDDVALVKSGATYVTVVPSKEFSVESGYYVNIDAGAIKDVATATNYAGISDATSWNFTTDHNPTDIQLSSVSVAENLVTHSVVAVLSATDPDASEGFDYQLVAGTGSTDNASFSHITAHDTLFTVDTFDYEKKSSYSIRLRAMDRRGGTFDKVFTISIANASDRMIWDNSTTSGVQTNSGIWGTNNYWSYNGVDLFPWGGAGHSAEFAGTDGTYTITVNGTQSTDSVIFTNNGYTLSGGTLAMTGSAPTIVSNANATISSALSGSFSKAGADSLVLSGSNGSVPSYTHLAGDVFAASNTALGAGSATMNGTGRIFLNAGMNLSNTLNVTACNPGIGNAVLNSATNANATWSGTINVNANCSSGGHLAGPSDLSGFLTVTGPINMGGTATSVAQRDGVVSYGGGGSATRFELTNGTARLGAANGLPSGAIWQQSHPSYTTTLDLYGYNQTFSMIYGQNTAASIKNSQGTASNLTLNGTGDTTYAGGILGNIALVKAGTGRQTISGTNTYTGSTTISGGTLALKTPAALGATSAVTVGSGATIDLGGQTLGTAIPITLNGTGVSNSGAMTNSDTGSAVYPGLVTMASSSTVSGGAGTISLSNTGAINGNGMTLTLGGAKGGSLYGVLATGAGGLTKTDAGTWILYSSGTYTGPTNISAGILQMARQYALPSASDLVVNGTLDMRGYNQTVGSLSGSGVIDKLSSGGTYTLTVGGNNTSTTFSGTLANSYGMLALTKIGNGTLTLTGTSAINGPTTISGGTLRLGATSALSSASAIVVSSTLDLGGYSTAIGSLAGSGTVDNSTGTGTYVLATGSDSTSTSFSGTIKNSTGSIALTKSSLGTLTLSGTNTYTGPTTINGGTLSITGSLSSPVTVASGATLSGTGSLGARTTVNGGNLLPGTLSTKGLLTGTKADLSGGTGSSLTIRIAGITTAGTDFDRLKLTDSLVLGGTSTLKLDLSGLASPGTATGIVQAGSISGRFTSVVVTNASGYSVGVVYNATSIDVIVLPTGTNKLVWDKDVAAGFTPSSGTWGTDNFWTDNGTRLFPWPSNGFTAEFDGSDGKYTVVVNGTQVVDSLSFKISGIKLSQGTLALGKGVNVASGKSDTLDRTLVTGAGLTLTGGGTLVVKNSAAQPFGFLNLLNGTFVASRDSGTTGDKLGTGNVTVSSGSTLVMDQLLQGDTYNNPLFLSGTGGGSGALLFQNNFYGATFNSPITLQADTRIGSRVPTRSAANDFVSLGGTISGPFNLALSAYRGVLRSTGIISVGGDVTIDQIDTVMLYKSNTYTGNTLVSGGTLQLGASEVIPNGAGKGNLSVDATVDLNGFSETVNGLVGSGSIDDNSTTASTLTVGDDNQSSTFSGKLRNTNGPISLTKIGTGVLTLSGSSSYKGATNVAAGTLNVTGGIDSTSVATVASGATLSGTGSIGGTIVGNGGTILPGTPTAIGVMDAKRLDLSGTIASTLKIRITATSKPGIEYDRLMLSDTLILGGNSVLELDLSGLSEIGSASGIVMAGGIVGTFKTVKILNYTGSVGATVSYRSTSIKVVFNNLAPTFTAGANQTVREDTTAQSVAGWATGISAGSPEESGQILSFTTTNTNNALFGVQPSVAANGTLSYTPAADANGTATVSVQLRDNGGTASGGIDSTSVQTFTITVTSANDAPSFAKGPDQSVLVNSSAQTIASWAGSISAGPSNESGQKLGFRISNNHSSLFAVQPTLSSTGTLSYTPLPDANGSATVYLRLGDDGGTANGGIDSSAIDSFSIRIHAPLTYKLTPDTLRIRPGDTGSFRITAKNGAGADTALDASAFVWNWTPVLGTLSGGRIAAVSAGTAIVSVQGLGLTDSGILIVAALDTTVPASKDSTTIDAGHGVEVTIPPHTDSLQIGVEIGDSTLGGGIAGADTSVSLTGSAGSTDSVLLKVPSALVPWEQIKLHGTPSAYWIDSLGKIHQVATKLLSDSSLVFWGRIGLTYWLGYDTLAPTTGSKFSGDSLTSTGSQQVDWTVSDNVVGTGTYFCLLQAGKAAPVCSLLVASDSTHGSLVFSSSKLPLGGRIWIESRDGLNVTRAQQLDIVVRIDTLRAPTARQEDRYEMLSLPYTSGSSTAHSGLARMWGADNIKRWRAFSIDTGASEFSEIVAGDTLDAWGRSFWVRTRKVALVPWVAGGWTPAVSNPVNVRLKPGWNAVGNPLGFDVDWRQIRKLSGLDSLAIFGPYRFDASKQAWTTPDTTGSLPAWGGVAVLNSTGRAIDLKIPSIASGAFAARTQSLPSRWRFALGGSQGTDTAQRIWMGLDPLASAGWNASDFPLPPSPTTGLRVYLPAPSGAATTSPFLTDVRPPTDSGVVWTVHVGGLRPKTPLVLDLAKTGTDTTISVWVRDVKSSRWLVASRSMDFAVGDETSREFQVVAGASPRDIVALRKFSLGNRGRALAWSLPDDMGRTRVKLELLDMLGRKTSTLLDENMDPGSYQREFAMPRSLSQQIVLLSAGGKQQAMILLRTR